MADYRELLRRAINDLPENQRGSRRAVYEKARAALVSQLRAVSPPLPAREITQHRLELESQIRQVESEYAVATIMQNEKVGREEATSIFEARTAEAVRERERVAKATKAEKAESAGPVPTSAPAATSDDLIAELARLMAQDAEYPRRPVEPTRTVRITGDDGSAVNASSPFGTVARIPVALQGVSSQATAEPVEVQVTPSAVAEQQASEPLAEIERLIDEAVAAVPVAVSGPAATPSPDALPASDPIDKAGPAEETPTEQQVAVERLEDPSPATSVNSRDTTGPAPQIVRTRTVRIYTPPPDAAAPPQRKDATGFTVGADGVDLAPAQLYEKLMTTPVQEEAYAGLRTEASAILEMGTNFLGDAAASLRKFSNALPVNMEEARLYSVWQAGNRLRRIYSAHQAVAGQPERHPAALDPAVAEMIGGLCDEFNNFAALDPGLRQRDSWRLPPTQRATSITEEFDTIEPLVQEAIDAKVVSPEAAAAVQSEIPEELPVVPDIVIPEIDLANRTRRNFIAALIEGAFAAAKKIALGGSKEVAHASRTMADGLYSNIGTGVGISMIWIVVKNAPALTVFAAQTLNSPQAVAAINWIVQVFGP